MSRARALSLFQWVGFFVAPAAWFAQHVIGQAIAQASCSAANTSWGVSDRSWQVALLAAAGTLILLSEAAAVAAFRSTDASYESPPPQGRVKLIAIAAMTTNLIYLVIVLLDGVVSIVDAGCRQS
ncbi:MAG TPA: hypothetical protein VGH92_08905 [Gaiellaceae bacterium]